MIINKFWLEGCGYADPQQAEDSIIIGQGASDSEVFVEGTSSVGRYFGTHFDYSRETSGPAFSVLSAVTGDLFGT